jgi:hypothetical protein
VVADVLAENTLGIVLVTEALPRSSWPEYVLLVLGKCWLTSSVDRWMRAFEFILTV